MDWTTFLNSPLATWIPILILVGFVCLIFRKQLGDLITRLTKLNTSVGKEGVGVELEADKPTSGETEQPAPATAETRPGVRAKGIKSRKGGLLVEDETGKGSDVEDVDVETDVLISSSDPKTKPPA